MLKRAQTILSTSKGVDKRKCQLTAHFQKPVKCVAKPQKSSLHQRGVQCLGDGLDEILRSASFCSEKPGRIGDDDKEPLKTKLFNNAE